MESTELSLAGARFMIGYGLGNGASIDTLACNAKYDHFLAVLFNVRRR